MVGVDDEGEYYLVERIIDSKINKSGEKEYHLKWKYLNDVENTWEKASNCFCTALIEEYENTQRKKRKSEEVSPVGKDNEKKPKKRVIDNENTDPKEQSVSSTSSQTDATKVENWDDLVSEVVTVFKLKNSLMMKLKWKEDGSVVTTPAEEANKKCPARVIEFYEKHLKFVG